MWINYPMTTIMKPTKTHEIEYFWETYTLINNSLLKIPPLNRLLKFIN